MVESRPLKGTRLAHQLLFWFLTIALIPLCVVTLITYRESSAGIEKEVTQSLNAIAKRQALEIQTYLAERDHEVTSLARDPAVIRAVANGLNAETVEFLENSQDSGRYQDLILTRGSDIIFSARNRVPVGAHLVSGSRIGPDLSRSILGQVFGQCSTLLTTSTSTLGEHPTSHEATLFIAAPVLEHGSLLGSVILELGSSSVRRVVDDYTGLGASGESLLIGADQQNLKLLLPSRTTTEGAFQLPRRSEALVRDACDGARWEGSLIDNRGRSALAVLRYLPQLQSAILIKIDEAEALGPISRLRNQVVLVVVITLALVLLAAERSARAISEPIGRLTRGTEIVSHGDLDHRLEVTESNEVGQLARAFNAMTGRLKDLMENLRVTVESKERIESELKIASDIQLSLLPKIFPQFLHRPEFDASATLIPAREVGGDLYDFFLVGPHQVLFLIGDVAGKGIPAALFMAVTKTLFKVSVRADVDLGELMRNINRELIADNETGMFVTVFCGLLNYSTGQLEYANAGHPPPYLIRADGSVESFPRTLGMGLGVAESDFETRTLQLRTGDTVFAFTDGLTEAEDAGQSFYGDARTRAFLNGCDSVSPRALVARAIENVRAFTQDAPQSDDIAVMAVTYYGVGGGGGGSNNRHLSVTVRSQVEELRRLAEAVESFGEVNALPERVAFQLNLALEELVSNVINYQHCRFIQVDVLVEGEELVVQLQDDGEELNPFARPEPDTALSLEERPIGGMGVHLVKTMFVQHAYRRQGGRNFITLRKPLQD